MFLPCFIFIDSELVLSFLHFQIDFLACSSVWHACIYVCGSGSHDNLKQRHIRKRAEVNQVWVLRMHGLQDRRLFKDMQLHPYNNCDNAMEVPTPKFPLLHYDRLRACSDRGSWRLEGMHLCTVGLWKQPVQLLWL